MISSLEDLQMVADFAVAHDIFVISDEIYEKLIYDEGKKHISIASLGKEIYDRTIVINGVSKSYAMTGWRIGFAAAPLEVAKLMASLQSHMASNPNSIAQEATLAALKGPQDCVTEMCKEFKKRRDYIYEREEAILAELPGNNCGGCGYPGCDGLAAAIAKGEAPVNGCPVGGEPVGKVIAAIMGQEVVETARQVAYVKCAGTCEKTKDNYEYTGVEDCEMMAFIPGGGAKSCTYGCLGFGSCVKACPFGAIDVVNGVAVVDKEACKACGKCVAKCPKHLIELVPYEQTTFVQCSSHAKGKAVTSACEVGCIGCKKCEKTCPNGAITVDNFCAHIDYSKCTNCGACKEVCPRHIIQ